MNYMTRDFTMPPYMVYPKFLLRIDINETARMIYIILLDRARLSLATEDYIDDYGHVYVFYTIDNLAQTLHKSDMTIKTALAALEDKRLIKRVHQGIGLPNKIYVRLPPIENAQNRGQKTVCAEDRNLSAGQKENFLRDGKKTFCLEERKLSGIKNEYIKNERARRTHSLRQLQKCIFI